MCSAGAKSNRQSFMCEPRDRTPPAASRHGQLTEVSMSWLAFRYALLHYIHTIQLYKPSTWATPSWTLTRVDVCTGEFVGTRYPISSERVISYLNFFFFFETVISGYWELLVLIRRRKKRRPRGTGARLWTWMRLVGQESAAIIWWSDQSDEREMEWNKSSLVTMIVSLVSLPLQVFMAVV